MQKDTKAEDQTVSPHTIGSSYKFSDFTILDIRVEELLRYVSMPQLSNSQLKINLLHRG